MQFHRNHKLIDADGHPIRTEDYDVASLPQVDRTLFDGLPSQMEVRLFTREGCEPALILFHPQAELYVLLRLGHDFSAGPMDISAQVADVNSAVLQQAMGQPPEADGYKVLS